MQYIQTVFALTLMIILSSSAHAQPSQSAVDHAKAVAQACPAQWDAPACLSAVSESNRVMLALYMELLQKSNHTTAAEHIKQECAASTAAAQDSSLPAYAVKSAYTVCANTIVDVVNKTGFTPDLSHYQLLSGAVMCMDENKAETCAVIEKQLVDVYR